MSKLKILLKAWLKKLLSDSHAAIVAAIIGLLFAGSYISLESVRTALNTALQSPTPLWVSIALALTVILYTYLKAQSFKTPPKRKPETQFLTVGDIKWKVTIDDSGAFEVNEMPYCAEHDLQFIESVSNSACPNFGNECAALVRNSDIPAAITHVNRTVESKIRNGVKLC